MVPIQRVHRELRRPAGSAPSLCSRAAQPPEGQARLWRWTSSSAAFYCTLQWEWWLHRGVKKVSYVRYRGRYLCVRNKKWQNWIKSIFYATYDLNFTYGMTKLLNSICRLCCTVEAERSKGHSQFQSKTLSRGHVHFTRSWHRPWWTDFV